MRSMLVGQGTSCTVFFSGPSEPSRSISTHSECDRSRAQTGTQAFQRHPARREAPPSASVRCSRQRLNAPANPGHQIAAFLSRLPPLMLHCRRASLGIVALLASGCGGGAESTEQPDVFAVAHDSSWFTERDALLTELSRREAQWAARRPPAYRFHATWAVMSYYYTGDVMAAVGRPLVVCDTLGAPADTVTRAHIGVDVPALFESIRTALTDTTHAVIVRFDSTLGFPAYVQVGNRWVTDMGYLHMVEYFRQIPEHRAKCAVDRATR